MIFEEGWCGRVDSNHHGIATASPSSWCVCQFRHDRVEGWGHPKRRRFGLSNRRRFQELGTQFRCRVRIELPAAVKVLEFGDHGLVDGLLQFLSLGLAPS